MPLTLTCQPSGVQRVCLASLGASASQEYRDQDRFGSSHPLQSRTIMDHSTITQIIRYNTSTRHASPLAYSMPLTLTCQPFGVQHACLASLGASASQEYRDQDHFGPSHPLQSQTIMDHSTITQIIRYNTSTRHASPLAYSMPLTLTCQPSGVQHACLASLGASASQEYRDQDRFGPSHPPQSQTIMDHSEFLKV
ncbi:hypothetical protein BGZ52_002979 [Haplosporangium bisporale]|nr:hypothetical protein BGZ52_002979 [Haplosporangium bisporale]